MRLATITTITIAASLALTACVSTAAPMVPDVLPAEAGHIVAAATATAAAMGTANAQGTQADLMARETATAARQSTLDALQAAQTESALSITQIAAQAEFTQQAAQNTRDFQSTEAWATPTIAALKTQTALTAIDDERRQASAESWAEFWATMRVLIVGLLIVAGLTAICVAGIFAATRIEVARMAAQAAIARESFRVLAPGHWAEWAPGNGYQVYPLPGLLDAPAAIIENAPTAPDLAHAWRHAVRLYAWWGDRYGFGLRELGPAGAGVVTDPAWRTLSKLLKGAGVLAELPIPGQKGRATTWAADWNYIRLAHELGHGPLALPYPSNDPAPEVRFIVPNTTPQDQPHNTATQATQKESAI